MDWRQLRKDKAEVVAAWRAIDELAQSEDRDLTAEETGQIEQLEARLEAVDAKISAAEADDRRRAKLAEAEQSLRDAKPLRLETQKAGRDEPDLRTPLDKLKAFTAAGMSRQEALQRIADQPRGEYAKQFDRWVSGSQAALQMDSDASGGFLVVPEQFLARLIQDLDRLIQIRQLATVLPLGNAESIGAPSLDTDMGDPTWTSELSAGSEDTSIVFGKRRLTPRPLARYIKVSKDLLRSSALSVEALVRERMAYKFAYVVETAFMTGTGANSPLGLFTAADAGISTTQDVSTDNTATSITADGLINAKYKLEGQWLNRGGLRWVFHRDAVKQIRKLKDGDGQYLWAPGIAGDRPDTILNVPVIMSEFAPNTFTASQYVGLIGDLSYYWIAESMTLEMQRVSELFALTNQDGFIGRLKLDGMPVLEKAFARIQLAAS